jgi:uncharacterized protein YcaQ
MPVLYDDRLVARLDGKYDRQNQKFLINGFWLEAWFKPDTDFADALAKGLTRFMGFLGAKSIDFTNLKPVFLHKYIKKDIESWQV